MTQTLWENIIPRSADASSAAYLRLLPHQGRYLAGGCESVGNAALLYPAYLGAYAAATGAAAWQHRASNLATCEQQLLPWGSGTAMVGNTSASASRPNDVVPLLEWFDAAGTSVRRQVLPVSQVVTRASAALHEADGGYAIVGFGFDPAGVTTGTAHAYTLTRTDSLGTVGWSRTYFYPGQSTQANLYTNDLWRTARGGYLLSGFASFALPSVPAGYTNKPWLVETDAVGALRRQVTLPVLTPDVRAQVNRVFNNTLALADGAHYALAGIADSDAISTRRWGFVAGFDTALQLNWVTRLPARRGLPQNTSRVRQLPNGLLQVLGYGNETSPYLFLTTLHPATGAILREEEFAVAGLATVGVWDWLPLGDSSIVVAGRAARPTRTGGIGPAQVWLGRYKLVARLPTALAAERAAMAPLRVYPSPAGAGEVIRAVLPPGAGAGQLVLHDALGRVVGTVAAPVGRAEVALPTAGRAAGLYLVEFVPDHSGQARAATRLLLH